MASAQAVVSDMSSPGAGPVLAGMTPAASGSGLLSQAEALERQKATDPNIERARQNVEKSAQEAEQTVSDVQKRLEGVSRAEDIKPWDAEKESAKYQTDPVRAFGSTGAVFALLASAFSHRPMINGLMGASAAMNAIKAGDEESYQRAYDAWKENTDLAIKRNEMQMSELKDIMEIAKEKPEIAQAELQAYSAKYEDAITAKFSEVGAWEKIAQVANSRAQLGLEAARLKPELEEANMKNQVYFGFLDKWRTDNGGKIQTDKNGHTQIVGGPKGPPPPEVLAAAWQAVHSPQVVMGGFGMNPTAGLPPIAGASQTDKQKAIDAIKARNPRAWMIHNYQLPPPSNFGSNSPQMKPLYDDLQALDGLTGNEYSAPRYQEVSKALRDWGSGKNGNTLRSMNVVATHLDTLDQLGKALNNNDVNLYNSVSNRFAAEFGQPAPTNFDAAKQIIVAEIEKAVQGSGSAGAMTDRRELEANILNSRSYEQISGAIGTFKALIRGQLGGLRRQYHDNTGLNNFEDLLSPEARQDFEASDAAMPSQGQWKIEQVH